MKIHTELVNVVKKIDMKEFNLRNFITEGKLYEEEGEINEKVISLISKRLAQNMSRPLVTQKSPYWQFVEAVKFILGTIYHKEKSTFPSDIKRVMTESIHEDEESGPSLEVSDTERKEEIYRFLEHFDYPDSWAEGESFDNWDDLFTSWGDWMDFYGHTKSDIEGMLKAVGVSNESFDYVMDLPLVQKLERG